MVIIGFIGLIGSGKSTSSDYLVNKYGFRKYAFSSKLKQICAIIFDWDINMLNAITPELREIREQKDIYWSNKLGFTVTPRSMLQYIGTEIMREKIHNDIWIISTIKEILNNGNDACIEDVRFMNEIQKIKDNDGIIIRIKRTNDPLIPLETQHISEYAWANCTPDYIIENNGSLDDLYAQLDKIKMNISI